MLDFEEFGERSRYCRHLDTGLGSVVIREACPILSSQGSCVEGLLLSGEKGENSTNGWRARIEDRGFHT